MKPAAQASKTAKPTRRAAKATAKTSSGCQADPDIEAAVEITNDLIDQYGLISDHERLF